MRSCPGKGASWAIRADTHVCWRESLGTFRFMVRRRWKSTRLSCPLHTGRNDPKQCPESRRPIRTLEIADCERGPLRQPRPAPGRINIAAQGYRGGGWAGLFPHKFSVKQAKVSCRTGLIPIGDLLTLMGGTCCGNGEFIAKTQQLRHSASTAPR